MITIQTATEAGTIVALPGCYVDGHRGQYAPDALAEIADSLLGTSLSLQAHVARQDDDYDSIVEIADDAMDALNNATSGGVWGWVDGEVFLIDEEQIDDWM